METQIKKTDYYKLSTEEILATLKSKKDGLSESESTERIKIYGENKIISSKKVPLIFKFFQQFKDLMVVILIVAGSFSLYLNETSDAIIMYSIVVINAIIGFIQEFKAEKTMSSLKNLIMTKAKVIRNGQAIEIAQEKIALGDIIKIEEGDSVPADLRVIEENNLSTNDFALTGESNPTRKFTHPMNGDAALGDRNNLVFMGTTVATGNGIGIVIHTGMDTEIGRIAHLSQEVDNEDSPLQKEINHLAKSITFVTLTIASGLTIIGLYMDFSFREAFLFGLGIAASCVPEGLPAEVSIALSLAAGRLATQKAIIKKLSAVETLGSTHIICTDKTGTLTKNEMTVQKILIGLEEFDVTGTGYEPKGTILDSDGNQITWQKMEENEIFFRTGAFASNATINPPDSEHPNWYTVGDPTEGAMISLALKAEENTSDLDKLFPEIKEFPFDSVRKRMSSLRDIHGKKIAFVKGSPQSLLEKCTKIKEGTVIRLITEEDKKLIIGKDDKYATQALRVLACAYKEITDYNSEIKMEDVEKELIFLGLSAMIDPPRDEVKDAIDSALKAHIRVIIITGDYALTAEAIAKKIGFNQDGHPITVIKVEELDKMSDIELLQNLINTNLIFSRTSPENKLRIVSLLKKTGDIVAVTGDGVNDAPALKRADIGVAMGKTGTEVSKNAAEIVLLDDSFSTLVAAIKEGRTIFQNLKTTIISSLIANGGELFTVLLSLAGTIFLNYPLAILAIQILAVDLVGELLPLTFLTWDPPRENIMKEPPRNPDQHVIDRPTFIDIALSGFLMGLVSYANFVLLFFRENTNITDISVDSIFYMRATTLTYITIVITQWFNIISRRAGSTESAFTKYIFSNKRLLLSYAISLIFLLNISYNPYISPFLRTAPLTLLDWGFAILGALVFFSIRETYKVFLRRKKQQQTSGSILA